MKGQDVFYGVLAVGVAFFGYKAYNQFFGKDDMSSEEKIDFSEQSTGQGQSVYPEKGDWDAEFSYRDVEQSELNPEKTLFRTTDDEGNLTTYKLNPEDLSNIQRWYFERGLWDFEDSNIQFGIMQGIERMLRSGLKGEDNALQTPDTNAETTSPVNPWAQIYNQTKDAKQQETKSQQIKRIKKQETSSSGSSYNPRITDKVIEKSVEFERAETKADKRKALDEAWAEAGL